MSTLSLHVKLINGSDAGSVWKISSCSRGFSSLIGMISSPTSFKLTMNLPTVTYFSAFLTNFKCYLTPVPLISVSGPVNGPSSILHSPNNLAYP